MVPKIIHYCWFGGKKLPELEQKCFESWKKHLPDYEIILWDESNSDLHSCEYVQQAYEQKKYAFVSDYIRIKALHEYGGIYLDTDVEVLKSFNHILGAKGFLGFENRTTVGTAVMACEKGSEFTKKMLDYYHTHSFIDKYGNQNLTTNVTVLNSIFESMGLERINKPQIVNDMVIYQREVFFPKKVSDTEFMYSTDTIAIHRMNGSWLTNRQRKRGTNKFWINICRPSLCFIQRCIMLLLGQDITKRIEIKIRNLLK